MQITTPLNFLQERETYLVVGSLAGYDRDPGWALNLKKNPQAWVRIKDKKMEVTARVVSGAERERLWVSSNQVLPLWQVFQQRTQRQFPNFVLTPKK
jgi:deazaflavin-dependent oxidoreductase (nitroreductase family)